jgi:hypothetical protein
MPGIVLAIGKRIPNIQSLAGRGAVGDRTALELCMVPATASLVFCVALLFRIKFLSPGNLKRQCKRLVLIALSLDLAWLLWGGLAGTCVILWQEVQRD